MIKSERLELYKKALVDFKKRGEYCQEGFCRYFHNIHGVYLYGDNFADIFPELYAQRPQGIHKWWYNIDASGFAPRIKNLEDAILIITAGDHLENSGKTKRHDTYNSRSKNVRCGITTL